MIGNADGQECPCYVRLARTFYQARANVSVFLEEIALAGNLRNLVNLSRLPDSIDTGK